MWGGKLYVVTKRGFAATCWECDQWLLIGEHVYVYFGGMVKIHALCAEAVEVVQLPTKPERTFRSARGHYIFEHFIFPERTYIVSEEAMTMPLWEIPRCMTRWPDVVCPCGEYRVVWDMRQRVGAS